MIQNPVHRAIEAFWAERRIPRIVVDARRKDVLVPDFCRKEWGKTLALDLDPSWPLNMEVYSHAICVDLAFQGSTHRCTIPWLAVYAVIDARDGRLVTFPHHEPPEQLPAELEYRDSEEVAKERRSKFGVIPGGKA